MTDDSNPAVSIVEDAGGPAAALEERGYTVVVADAVSVASAPEILARLHEAFGRGFAPTSLTLDWFDDLLDGEPGFDTGDRCAIVLHSFDDVWRQDAKFGSDLLDIAARRSGDYRHDGGDLLLIVEVSDPSIRADVSAATA